MIQFATMFPWSHCGIIIEKGKVLYVLEASSVVKLTPLQQCIDKGRSGGAHKARRVFEEPIKISYKKYLGKKYDLAFKMDNGKFYCSELVWVIYKEQFDIELCKLSGLTQKIRSIEDNIVVLRLELAAESYNCLSLYANLAYVFGKRVSRQLRVCQYFRHIASAEMIVHHL